MNVIVTVDRTAAINAGSDLYGTVAVDLDPSTLGPEDRAILAAAPEINGVTDLTASFRSEAGGSPPRPVTAQADPAAWIAWRREMTQFTQARERAERERVERELAAYLAWAREQPVKAFLRDVYSHSTLTAAVALPDPGYGGPRLPSVPVGLNLPLAETPERRAKAALREQMDAAAVLLEERKAQTAARRAAEEAEKTAAANRRRDQLAAAVRDLMDDNAQGRYRLGLLPEAEILDSLRARLYAGLDDFPRYVKLREGDIEHEEHCYGDAGMTCETLPADGIDAERFERYREIEAASPEGSELTVLVHVCTCDRCDGEARSTSVRVALTAGELSFSREYALQGAKVEPLTDDQLKAIAADTLERLVREGKIGGASL